MWVALSLGAAVFWGILYVLKEQIYGRISVFTSLAISSLFLFIVSLTVSSYLGYLKRDIFAISSSKQTILYVALGLVILFCAEILIGFSITAKNATLAGLIEISYPVFIALFGYLFFKKVLPWETLIGALLVFVGIFVIYHFNK